MKRLLALAALLACAPAIADLTVKVSPNFDATIDTQYRAGDKPSGSSCTTWTAATKGDATIDCDEVSASEINLTVSSSDEEGNVAYAYQSEATDADMQLEARITDGWTGNLEDFAGFGILFTEGAGDNDYSYQVWWPYIGTARRKIWDGTSDAVTGSVGQFLPYYLAITYDDSETEICAYESSDAVDWSIIGSCTTKSLTFPVRYAVFGTSHEPIATTTATIDNIAYTNTIDIVDAGPPDPPTGNDFPISSGTTTFNCNSNGVQPGDTLTFQGTSRNTNIEFVNCVGTEGNEIVLRNDPTQSSPFTINVQGGRGITGNNVEHFQIDGTGGWVGQSSTICGSDMPGGDWDNRTSAGCGIRLIHAAGEHGGGYIYFTGSSEEFEVRGVFIDGRNLGRGNGIHVSDPAGGSFRDGLVVEDSVIQDNVTGSTNHGAGIYLGPNAGEGKRELGDVTIRGVWINNTVDKCITVKSSLNGDTLIEWNYLDQCAQDRSTAAIGTQGTADLTVRNNIVIHNGRSDANSCIRIQHAGGLSSGPDWPIKVYNNVIYDCIDEGIHLAFGGATFAMVPEIYNNTIVNTNEECIRTDSVADNGGNIFNNICAGTTGISIAAGGAGPTVFNNIIGSIGAQNFVNSGADNYQLTASSAARNSGNNQAPAADILEVSRPQEGVDDIGAYEYVP